MNSTTITREIPVEQCLNGKTRETTTLDDDAAEDFIEWEKDIVRREALRDLAREKIDEDDLPEADSLLWVDRAEVYSLCSSCYYENNDGAWTGSTSNPNYDELREHMEEKLREGTPCTFCKSERVKVLADELAETVDVEVVVVE